MFDDFGDPRIDLIRIDDESYDILFDIRYATINNFTNKKIYNHSGVYIHYDLLEIIKLASKRARLLGYKIKIFDAWRPYEIQEVLWSVMPDPRYVSNPENGFCGHCRGVSLDITLVKVNTMEELDMGTEFDAFTTKAHHSTTELSVEQLQNRVTLAGIMSSVGMRSLSTEWWHYDLHSDKKYPKYKLADFKN